MNVETHPSSLVRKVPQKNIHLNKTFHLVMTHTILCSSNKSENLPPCWDLRVVSTLFCYVYWNNLTSCRLVLNLGETVVKYVHFDDHCSNIPISTLKSTMSLAHFEYDCRASWLYRAQWWFATKTKSKSVNWKFHTASITACTSTLHCCLSAMPCHWLCFSFSSHILVIRYFTFHVISDRNVQNLLQNCTFSDSI